MKKNAALVVAFLCLLTFIMPWGAVVSDPFYIHTYSIFASTLLVMACNRLSRESWSTLVQISECTCIIYQAQVVMNWDSPTDGFYRYHDEFMMSVFIFELFCISTSIKKIAAVMDGITSTLGRTFLSVVRLYPSERGGINLRNDKEHHQC